MIYKTAVLAEHERGVLLRDQTIIDLVKPGRHRWLDPWDRLRLEIFDTDRVVMDSTWANRILRQHPDLAGDDFVFVRPEAGQLALIMLDGAPYTVVALSLIHI